MKAKSLLILPLLGFTSCSYFDPDYAAYQQQQRAQQASQTVQDASNPYAIPDTESYTQPVADATPYQPVDPINPPVSSNNNYVPSPPSAPTSSGSNSHTVAAGDSLWGLARKYGTTVEAIQAANGLSGSTIRTGQKLTIPR